MCLFSSEILEQKAVSGMGGVHRSQIHFLIIYFNIIDKIFYCWLICWEEQAKMTSGGAGASIPLRITLQILCLESFFANYYMWNKPDAGCNYKLWLKCDVPVAAPGSLGSLGLLGTRSAGVDLNTLLGLVGWRIHAGIQNPVLVHDLLHQFLLLPAKLAQLLSAERQKSNRASEWKTKGRSDWGFMSRIYYQ